MLVTVVAQQGVDACAVDRHAADTEFTLEALAMPEGD